PVVLCRATSIPALLSTRFGNCLKDRIPPGLSPKCELPDSRSFGHVPKPTQPSVRTTRVATPGFGGTTKRCSVISPKASYASPVPALKTAVTCERSSPLGNIPLAGGPI